MKKLSPNIIVLLVVFLLNCVAIFLYYYVFNDIHTKNGNVAEIAGETEIQKEQNIENRALRSILLNTREDRERIDAHVLKDDDVVVFIETIENLGPQSGVAVITSSVNVDDSSGNASTTTGYLKLKLNAQGTWENILHFVSLIENLPNKISVERFSSSISSVNAEVKTKGPQTWQSAIELKVLKLKK